MGQKRTMKVGIIFKCGILRPFAKQAVKHSAKERKQNSSSTHVRWAAHLEHQRYNQVQSYVVTAILPHHIIETAILLYSSSSTSVVQDSSIFNFHFSSSAH